MVHPNAIEPFFTPEQFAKLLELLGLPVETVDAELILATVEDLAQQANDEQKPSDVAAAAKRAGLEVIDNAALVALRHDAAEGRQIKAAAARQKIDTAVDDAINKGKITLARKKHWVSVIEADPAMADVLASYPDELVVPLSEIGHGVESEPGARREEWFY